MTSTPESWDDVGCLRLQVDCVSQKVENVQLQFSDFQKLSDRVALAREHEKKNEKVCLIFTAVLFGCVVALLVCVLVLLYMTVSGGPAPRLMQNLSDDLRTTHVGEFKDSETTALVKNIGQQPKQKPVNDAAAKLKELLAKQRRLERENMEISEKMVSMLKHLEEAEKATMEKPGTSWNVVDTKESGPRQTHEPELQKDQHPRSSTDDEGHNQWISKSPEATQDEPFSLEDHDMRGALPPLPFQMWNVQSNAKASMEVLERAFHGMFWVCFPATALKQFVKTYTPVFNNVAHSQKWRMYPFVYLDTRRIKTYYEHFCDDVSKVTFVMEKRSDVISDSKNISSQRIAPGNLKWIKSETRNPNWFRRVFEPDQVIHAHLVEEFLNDVHSGKLPELRIAKGDL